MRGSASKLIGATTLLLAAGCGVILGLDDHELASAPLADASGQAPYVARQDGSSDPFDSGSTGPTEVITLATEQDVPRGLALDATRAYWASYGSGKIMAVDKAGGSPEMITSDASAPIGVVVDDSDVYWTSNENGYPSPSNGILRKPKAGGPIVRVQSDDSLWTVTGLASDSGFIYWTTTSRLAIYATSKSGAGGGPLPGPLLSARAVALAVDAQYVFWTQPSINTVGRRTKGNGSIDVLAKDQAGLSAIAADATDVYFTTLAAVMRVPASGGTPSQIGPALDGPVALALTATDVYVASADGSILRLAKSDGAMSSVATGEAAPISLAVDETGAYWTTKAGTVRKRPF